MKKGDHHDPYIPLPFLPAHPGLPHMRQALLWAAAGTGFTFLMTTLGAAMVFLLRRRSSPLLQRIFLGFAAGVMIAASVWSLLIPAIEEAEAAGGIGWVPAAGGFVLGGGGAAGVQNALAKAIFGAESLHYAPVYGRIGSTFAGEVCAWFDTCCITCSRSA